MTEADEQAHVDALERRVATLEAAMAVSGATVAHEVLVPRPGAVIDTDKLVQKAVSEREFEDQSRQLAMRGWQLVSFQMENFEWVATYQRSK